MAELAKRSVDVFEAGKGEALTVTLRGALDFLDGHLPVWIPKLLERTAKTETDWLYPKLLVLDRFLRKDRDPLIDLLAEGVQAYDGRRSACEKLQP